MSATHTQTFTATGLTCGHCANAVVDELSAIEDVNSVGVELVKGGASTITIEAGRDLSDAEVQAAHDEAGNYTLV